MTGVQARHNLNGANAFGEQFVRPGHDRVAAEQRRVTGNGVRVAHCGLPCADRLSVVAKPGRLSLPIAVPTRAR